MSDILIALNETFLSVLKIGMVLPLSLLGAELMLYFGLFNRLTPLARPLTRCAHLPPTSAPSFLMGFGSMILAHTTSAALYQEKKLTRQELTLTVLLSTVPQHIKRSFTYQLPIVLPLLGIKIGLIYMSAFWLAGLLKLIFVICYGRMTIRKPRSSFENTGEYQWSSNLSQKKIAFTDVLKTICKKKGKMVLRMLGLFAAITFSIKMLVASRYFLKMNEWITPFASLFDLPSAVIAPLSVYILSPTAGITYMSALIRDDLVSGFHVIVSLLAGGIFMAPMLRLRLTLPKLASIFGFQFGVKISILVTAITIIARMIVLLVVIYFIPF